MKLLILPAAVEDLKEIDSWVAEQHGEDFARVVQDELLATMEMIADYPEMGRTRPEITARPVRFFSHWPYWIVYQSGSPLRIHRVLHGARDLPKLIG